MVTYQDFEKLAKESSLYTQFSAYDLALARENPAAGLSLLSLKQQYAEAATPEQKVWINAQAEQVRKENGGYTAGREGKYYYAEPVRDAGEEVTAQQTSGGGGSYDAETQALIDELMKQSEYSYGRKAPTYDGSKARRKITGLADQIAAQQPFSYGEQPTYQGSQYDDTVKRLAGEVANRSEFAYDQGSDPSWAAYRKQYNREGDRAAANALGQAAAATGGVPSSYAVGASQQAGNYYAAALADKLPELYQQAYQRYLDEQTLKNSALGVMNGLAQQDYSRYRDQVGDYQANRSFDYAAYLDQYQQKQNALENYAALEGQDYSRYRDQMGDYQTDRSFDYGKYLDDYQRKSNLAWTLASTTAKEKLTRADAGFYDAVAWPGGVEDKTAVGARDKEPTAIQYLQDLLRRGATDDQLMQAIEEAAKKGIVDEETYYLLANLK